jgi:hypothetical protein
LLHNQVAFPLELGDSGLVTEYFAVIFVIGFELCPIKKIMIPAVKPGA